MSFFQRLPTVSCLSALTNRQSTSTTCLANHEVVFFKSAAEDQDCLDAVYYSSLYYYQLIMSVGMQNEKTWALRRTRRASTGGPGLRRKRFGCLGRNGA